MVRATERDTALILRFIKSLAEYERASHKVTATEQDLRAHLFGSRSIADAAIAYADDEPAGFVVFFPTFSTFLGRPGLYVEDLFVEPRWRRHGLGRKLFAYVANLAATRGCHSVSWSVLRWNEPAIRFYRSLGAEPVEEWAGFGISGEAFARLAREAI
ncbi:MAG: GNAT family N-acetyltransferase [Candidatus Binatia bacterium]